MTDDEYDAVREAAAADETRLSTELAEIPPPLIDFDPAALTDPRVVSAMTLDEKREMIRLFIRKITINRARPPYDGRVDSDRVAIEWRS